MHHYTHYLLRLILALLCLGNTVQASPLRLSSWNLEWMTSEPHERVHRNRQDIQVLARQFQQIQPDVLFFQEVNDRRAIAQIVGTSYQVMLSDRSNREYKRYQFSDINQYTGFAVKKGLKYSDPKDVPLIPGSKLRFASYLILWQGNQPIHLLSVHLKTGCFDKFVAGNKSCQRLRQEATALNRWIQQREQRHEAYIIAGDFNHHLTRKRDWFWKAFTRNLKASPQLASRSTRSSCHVRSKKNRTNLYQHRQLIDHIVVSPSVHAGIAVQSDYDLSQLRRHQLSDHCPLSVTIGQ